MLEHLWTSLNIRTEYFFPFLFPRRQFCVPIHEHEHSSFLFTSIVHIQVGLIIVSSLYFTACSVQPAVFINVLIINTCLLLFRVILSCGQNGQTT